MLKLTENELERARYEYERDGATVLRNVVSSHWIDRLSKTIDDILLSGSTHGRNFNRPGDGRFFGDLFAWLHQPEFAAFIREAGLAEVAGKIMNSKEVRFFYDQLLVKEPGSTKRTPWHQDLPYWPVRGEQIVSLWVPIDTATPENGVVTYVKGSHRWNAFYRIENWSDNSDDDSRQIVDEVATETAGLETYRDGPNGVGLRDIVEHPERHEFVTWNVEPGDVIVHHPLAVHGAPGNLSQNARRRALATRWLGDDARWDESRPHFMRMMKKSSPDFPYPVLQTGDKVRDQLFPVVWTAA